MIESSQRAHTRSRVIISVFIVGVIVAAYFVFKTVNRQEAERNFEERATKFGLLENAVLAGGKEYLVAPEAVFETGLSEEDVPILENPAYVTVRAIDSRLADDVFGVGISVDGEQYFYPYQILNWHHIVVDEIGGQRLAITYDPLCFSERVYVLPEGMTLTYSGHVYNNHALLEDQNGNLWLQERGVQVVGEDVGAEFERVDAVAMTWGDWKVKNPEGNVLSMETGVTREYGVHPYGSYDVDSMIYFPITHEDDRVSSKWRTYSLVGESSVMSFVSRIMEGAGVQNIEFEGRPITAFYDVETGIVRVFSSVVDEDILTFTYDFDEDEIRDEQTDTLWSPEGVAIDGELEGTRLSERITQHQFWFCTADLYPEHSVQKLDEEESKTDQE